MKVNKYLKLLLVPIKIEAISIAIDLKIFDLLQKELPISKIAEKLNCDSVNMGILLDSLAMLKLLKKEKGLYKNSSFSNKYLVLKSDYYFGDLFLYRKSFLNKNKNLLHSLVKDGYKEDKSISMEKNWAEASQKYFYQEQRSLTSYFVVKLIRDLKGYKSINKMLDLGCSSGILGLEIVKHHPTMKAVLFDFDEVIKVANKNISNYNLNNRVSVLGGNIELDDIGSGYDLIFCSNVLSLLPNKEKVVDKIYNALNSNGILIILHTDISEDIKKHEDSYFYLLSSQMQGITVINSYDFSNLILDSGFKSVHSFPTYKVPLSPTMVHIAKK